MVKILPPCGGREWQTLPGSRKLYGILASGFVGWWGWSGLHGPCEGMLVNLRPCSSRLLFVMLSNAPNAVVLIALRGWKMRWSLWERCFPATKGGLLGNDPLQMWAAGEGRGQCLWRMPAALRCTPVYWFIYVPLRWTLTLNLLTGTEPEPSR